MIKKYNMPILKMFYLLQSMKHRPFYDLKIEISTWHFY